MSDRQKSLAKFKNLISGKKSFLLITHLSPDGDAVGATIALAIYLRSLKKTARMVSISPIPVIFDFLRVADQFADDFLLGDFEAIILIDCGDLKRTGFSQRLTNIKGKIPIVNIDHHPQNDIWKISQINLADPDSPSTCQILYQTFVNWEADISPAQATALLTGIYYDTGGFLHSNTSNQVLEITSQLLRAGAKLKQIAKSVSQSRTPAMLKLWGLALNRMIVDSNLGLIISIITQDDLIQLKANEEELSGLVNILNTALEAKAAILLYETSDGKIKGSLRTEKDDVDVSQIAALFGGGGHKKAAGFLINGKFEKIGQGWKVV